MTDFKKILIIRLSSLGDVLLTTPVLRAIKKQWPDITVDFLVGKNYLSAIETNPLINEVFEFDKEKNPTAFVNLLNKKKYDLIIDLQNNLRSRNLTSKLPFKKVRFKKPTLKKLLLVHFKWNRFKELKTIPQMYAESIPGLEFNSETPEINLPEKIVSSIKPANNFIGFAPGSKHFTKMWPVEYYIDLGKKLNEAGFTILLFGGAADKEICEEIHNSLSDSIDLSTNNDLLQIARDMRECRLIICNDSGLMHLAQAVDVPLFAFFGSTVKEFGFFPYTEKSKVIENEGLYCRPCSHIGKAKCPKKHFRCMLELTPDNVFNEIEDFLNTK